MSVPVLPSELSGVWTALGLLSLPALVAINGLFVAAEFALVAVRKTRVDEMVRQGRGGAADVRDAVSNLYRSIAATQLGITLASIALGWVAEPALAGLLEPAFHALPSPWAGGAAHAVAVALAFLLITFAHVVFGELVPKTMALQRPDQTALWVARPLGWFAALTRPLVAAMNGVGGLVLRACGFQPAAAGEAAHSAEELESLVDETQEAGKLAPAQAAVLRKAFRLSGRTVRDCMVPRGAVDAVEVRAPAAQVLDVIRRTAHTRLPVYDGDLDRVVGVANTKDLLMAYVETGVVSLGAALYPPLFLGPDGDVSAALEALRAAGRPMALVRDGEGPVLGMITLENVVEEIVGEIEDEHDRPTPRQELGPEHRAAGRRAGRQADLGPPRAGAAKGGG
ncbi:hemolysin family protein [Gemmata sp.]|uniref:hemolysin family protein n=1 Tax=Gemmata sp. TaxID=1914242 RepID=UPI003F723F4C